MNRHMSLHRRNQIRAGSIMILTAFGAVLFLGLTALVTDIGWVQFQQSRLQTAVNAGWKGGYDQMMKIVSTTNQTILNNTPGQALVRGKVLEVMKANGFNEAELATVQVNFGPDNFLQVTSQNNIGLFFAKVIGFTSTDIAAQRQGDGMLGGTGIVPLAIPHGVAKDLSKSVFTIDFFGPDGGFASGSEYILKLGSGGGHDPNKKDEEVLPPADDDKRILVPMDAGAQTELGYQRAYGAAFWCLKIDAADPGYTPVDWLLGYRGGAFFLPFAAPVEDMLKNYGVNYTVIAGAEAINAIYTLVGENCVEMIDRPRMAIYSSQNDTDPVEQIFRDAYIPYGEYSKPPALSAQGWARNDNYDASRNNRIYDSQVLAGGLNGFHWVHMHDEDFTGFSGGCSFWVDACKDFYDAGRLGSTVNKADRALAAELMCPYCRLHFNPDPAKDVPYWTVAYNPRPVGTEIPNCLNARRRCTEKATYAGALWRNNPAISLCRSLEGGTSQCSEFNSLLTVANANAIPAVAGAEPKSYKLIAQDGSSPISPTESGWFNTPTKVQQLKWNVARAVRSHISAGGFLFAQDLAPETLDLGLWQSSIYAGAGDPFSDCLAFTGMTYKAFPRTATGAPDSGTFYSSINTNLMTANQPFTLAFPLDIMCQNHGIPDSGRGHTSSFQSTNLKPGLVSLGADGGGNVKYLKGALGTGHFTFLAGHSHLNIQSKRLVLNNILFGTLVAKHLDTDSAIGLVVTGKQKSNYGVVDPDNFNAGGANDYRDRFMFGFNQPLQVNDRLMNEGGNMSGPTDQSVDFRINGDSAYPPRKRVIIPITDVPPEVNANNAHNASATSIYDLQGTDHPNGVYDPEAYAFGSSVRIIGFAEFEIIDPSEYSREGETVTPGDTGDLGPYQSGQVRGKFIRYIIKPGEIALE